MGARPGLVGRVLIGDVGAEVGYSNNVGDFESAQSAHANRMTAIAAAAVVVLIVWLGIDC